MLKCRDTTTGFLQQVAQLVKFKKWYFGHWHVDQNIGKFKAIYGSIDEIK